MSYPTKAEIKRTCAALAEAAAAVGIKVVGFTVTAAGAISVWDKTAEPEAANELEEWRAKRRKG